ncbi:hypothetical protein RFI_27976 [Reticulomyxa filosa]|uniref:Uncharacterized protein n=1 Tax=Reticulomyxa filosa TaxID=46433 RepID=X6M720_RETFI|nr:hypothetical protein RFI_27976 [Reticulomyxa filosa]|eukprot:ETO09401.1 hypothetical protein RFI_27976 [Reticulomyxa filosa]
MQNNIHLETLFSNFLQALVKNWTTDLVYQKDVVVKNHVFLPERVFFDNFGKTFESETRRHDSVQPLVEAFLGLLSYPNKVKVLFFCFVPKRILKQKNTRICNAKCDLIGMERQLNDLWNVIDAIEDKYPQAPLFQRNIQDDNNPSHFQNKGNNEESIKKIKNVEKEDEDENENKHNNHLQQESEEHNSYVAPKGRDGVSKRTAQVCEPIIDFVVSRMLLRIISLIFFFFGIYFFFF